MSTLVLSGHYDGNRILVDEPFEMEPNTKVLITVLQDADAERRDWLRLSAQQLAEAYGDNEPEYTLADVREMNPGYERG